MKKSEIKEHLEKLIKYYEDIYGFKCSVGYNQVIMENIGIIVEYGKYAAICDLYEELFCFIPKK